MDDDTRDETEDEVGRQIRPFADWLLEQRGGLTHSELSDTLNDVIEAVDEYRKAGSLTFTVKVDPSKGNAVVVTDSIKATIPTADRDGSIFFVDDHKNLQRDDPRQPRLPLRDVSKTEQDDLREAQQ